MPFGIITIIVIIIDCCYHQSLINIIVVIILMIVMIAIMTRNYHYHYCYYYYFDYILFYMLLYKLLSTILPTIAILILESTDSNMYLFECFNIFDTQLLYFIQYLTSIITITMVRFHFLPKKHCHYLLRRREGEWNCGALATWEENHCGRVNE